MMQPRSKPWSRSIDHWEERECGNNTDLVRWSQVPEGEHEYTCLVADCTCCRPPARTQATRLERRHGQCSCAIADAETNPEAHRAQLCEQCYEDSIYRSLSADGVPQAVITTIILPFVRSAEFVRRWISGRRYPPA